MEINQKNNPHKRQGKDTKREYAKKLFDALYDEPLSRRMAATKIGYTDQTYMVTQDIYDWIRQGKAYVTGIIKCSRSGRFVEAISTNPDFVQVDNQMKLF